MLTATGENPFIFWHMAQIFRRRQLMWPFENSNKFNTDHNRKLFSNFIYDALIIIREPLRLIVNSSSFLFNCCNIN